MGEMALPWPAREPEHHESLAARMCQVAEELAAEPTEQSLAEAIVTQAVALVPSAAHASLLVPRRGHLVPMATTSLLACEADRAQLRLDQGPCHEVADVERLVTSSGRDLHERWPRWGAEVSGLGVRGVLAAPIDAGPGVVARLLWYAERPGDAGADEVATAALFARHAGHAYAAMRLAENLRLALQSRHGIGVAQGILMERYGLTLDRAFSALRRRSSETNVKLVDVARRVVEST
jgi:hypothetical protein